MNNNIISILLFSLCYLFIACESDSTEQDSVNEVVEDVISPYVSEVEDTVMQIKWTGGETAASSGSPKNVANKKKSFSYDMKLPSNKFQMNNTLNEISGIAYEEHTERIFAVNDEVGRVYILDAKDGSIQDKKKFAGPGDYEDICVHRDRLFVLKSNGKIYVMNSNDFSLIREVKTDLSISNDVEGMCYDPETARLLLACKGSPDLKMFNFNKKTKTVFSFNPVNDVLNKTPVLKIDTEDLENFVKKYSKGKKKKIKKKLNRVEDVAPSAIAVHPIENKIYVLSSVGKLLLVYNRDNSIEHVVFLDSDILAQPEGMSFASNGDMLISNERKGRKANILKFEYKR